MLTAIATALLLGYLVGSVPFGFIIARCNGVDIQSVGSGNIGATNVLRTLGKGWGLLTFVLDFLKGLLPVLFIGWLLQRSNALDGTDTTVSITKVVAGVAAILGHSFSCFLNFTGGKGVATGAGMLVGLVAPLALLAFLVWVAALALGRMVSLSSIAAALAIGVGAWLPWFRPVASDGGNRTWVLPVALSLLALLIIFRHRSNIGRIFAGTERKIGAPRS